MISKKSLKRAWRRFITWGAKLTPVYKNIETPRFVPKEDITAYELALYLKQPKLFTSEAQLMEWRQNFPDSLKRHYKFVEEKCIVGWDY